MPVGKAARKKRRTETGISVRRFSAEGPRDLDWMSSKFTEEISLLDKRHRTTPRALIAIGPREMIFSDNGLTPV